MRFDKYEKRGADYHWGQISRSITRRNIFVAARYETVLRQMGNCRGKRVLDVGCGDGVLSYLLSRRGFHVTGLDVAREAVGFASEKTKNTENIEFITASASHLPFKSGSLSYVVSSDVIEHLKEPQKMLAEIKRVFDGSGRIIITTPLRFTETPSDEMHVQEFYESDLRRLLEAHFTGNIRIIKSHPLVFMELQNRHFLIRCIFNVLNILFRFNPFLKNKGWRYYAMQTAVIEGSSYRGSRRNH
jgi:2-polyprenyl-3-methyl-5-hydroxy-6-metoxy-1,4-benzoquinol methylase